MKKIAFILLGLIISLGSVYAQSSSELRKERQEIRKMAQSELRTRVDRNARKEAKRLKSEGWRVMPGSLPLEKQVERSYLMQYEYDDDLFPKYIMGDASSIGENYDAAKSSAQSIAVTNIAGQLNMEVSAYVENTVANRQMSADDAASLTESVMANKNVISQSISRTLPIVECYRITNNNRYEVFVRYAYDSAQEKAKAKQACREEMLKHGRDMHNKLDKMLGL